MTYQVLARKWRPKDFASLVGQEHVVRALTHALDGGRLHHAYLFTGTRGVGKTTLSRIFAKALNCETGVTSTPCGVCRACREIDEGRFVDYVEMDAASNRGVDEMAALLERAVYAPVDARFKVYMIDEVHMLTNYAFNAMLKTLEEPPAHVKFILATTDPQKIPVTVLSRCLQFNLKQMPAGHIVSHLEHILGEEQVPYDAQALRLLARAADGSMRDALSLTDQAIAYSANQVNEEAVRGMLGALDQSYLIRLLDALADGDGASVLSVADEMALRSLSFSTALQDLASLLHRVAWAQFAPSSVLDEWPEAADLRRFADTLSAEQVQLFYQIATIGRSELGLAPDEYAGFTMTLLRMLAFEPAPTGGGGGATGGARAAGAAGTGAGKRAAASAALAAPQRASAAQATPVAASPAADVPAVVARRVDASPETSSATFSKAAAETPAPTQDPQPATSSAASAKPAADAPVALQDPQPAAVPVPRAATPVVDDAAAALVDTPAASESATAEASSGSTEPAQAVEQMAPARKLAPWEDADTAAASSDRASNASESTGAIRATASAGAPSAEPVMAAAAQAVQATVPEVATPVAVAVEAAITSAAVSASTPATEAATEAATAPAPRRAGGASDALNVLRSAGLKVSPERGRAPAGASVPPVTPKPAAPRVVVNVPTPGAPRRAADSNTAPAAATRAAAHPASPVTQNGPASNGPAHNASGRNHASSNDSSIPPWDDMPLDEYMPLTAADEGYYGLPDDSDMPVFDSGPDDVRMQSAAPSAPPPVVDQRPLPPAVPLDPLGFTGDWPALAVDLPLKGISYQLAFNSELMALEGSTLKLNVPVPQYAEASQVAKLKIALVERLGRNVDLLVEVGPARRTAAARDTALRAQRQQEAEREIGADPFVQSLIREFGARIVPGSVRPLTPDAANGASPAH